ncbi:MAG TPA: hypothetical protein VEC36_11655 [Patescibacteria group bacterium]|nr:hypothetical protein [Patescibacteria group bacterium]
MADILDVLCTTEYDRELECVITVWHGYASSNQFRAICERALELIKKHGAKKGISDNRGMKNIAVADQEWLLKNYLPRVVKTGYNTSASVIPTDQLAQMTVRELASKIDNNIIHQRFFKTLSEARTWIRTA